MHPCGLGRPGDHVAAGDDRRAARFVGDRRQRLGRARRVVEDDQDSPAAKPGAVDAGDGANPLPDVHIGATECPDQTAQNLGGDDGNSAGCRSTQIHVEHAIGKGLGDVAREAQCQCGLAGAARPVHEADHGSGSTADVEARPQCGQFLRTAHERRRGRGQGVRNVGATGTVGQRRVRGGLQHVVLPQNGLFQPAQVTARLHAEFVDQFGPDTPVVPECLRGSATAVERDHQLAAQPLAQRVFGGEFGQSCDELDVAAEPQGDVDAVLQHAEVGLLEPGRLHGAQWWIPNAGQWSTAPERERLVEQFGGAVGVIRSPCGRRQGFQPMDIQLPRLEAEAVPGRRTPQHGLRQDPAQPLHVVPHGDRRASWRVRTPEVVDDRVDRDRRAAAGQ